MKFIHIILCFLIFHLFLSTSVAQQCINNPLVVGPDIDPAPLLNGEGGEFGFTFALVGNDYGNLIRPLRMTVCMQNITIKDSSILNITGDISEKFDWSFDLATNCLIATQNTTLIGDNTDPILSGGRITVQFVQTKSVDCSEGNKMGFNVNIQPAPCMNGINTTNDDNVSSFTCNLTQNAQIGNFVWVDKNANGVQDSHEIPLLNVKVVLYKKIDTMFVKIDSTLTNNLGKYNFDKLDDGKYKLLFLPLDSTYLATKKLNSINRDSLSDIDIFGFTDVITLLDNQIDTTIDAGYFKLGKIGDYVWEDVNQNGIQDQNEIGINGVSVTLNGINGFGETVNLITMTDTQGRYSFENVSPGFYTLSFALPDGFEYKYTKYKQATDDARDSDVNEVTGTTATFELCSGENNLLIDAGMFRCANIGDYVWIDIDNNGLQDLNEEGLNGIEVLLFNQNNPSTPFMTTTTTSNNGNSGYYNFEVCSTGEFFIQIIKPDAYNFTSPTAGDGTNDSKITDIINGKSDVFTIGYANKLDDLDIGLSFVPLPIELLTFDGHWNESKKYNLLQWSTASEINNDYFDIQRKNEYGDFESIGKVSGYGNATQINNYHFEDFDITESGNYFYRLKQVDFDGNFSYSKLLNILVSASKDHNVILYPNPSNGNTTLQVEDFKNGIVKINIYDSLGHLISREAINEDRNNESVEILLKANNLINGIYHVILEIDGAFYNLKWCIIH